jgi:hypothetical protein
MLLLSKQREVGADTTLLAAASQCSIILAVDARNPNIQ